MLQTHPTQKDRTMQAFALYMELADTATWLSSWMLGSLESWDLSMQGFRLLLLLERKGTASRVAAARAVGCTRQGINDVARHLEESGWVEREFVILPAVEGRASQVPKAKRGKPRVGPRIGVIRLTGAGRKFVSRIFPKHAKWVKATMRVLNYREQKLLMRLCRKLREGDSLKLIRELRMEEVEE